MSALIIAFLGAIGVSLVGRQIWEVLPHMADLLLKLAVVMLPKRQRERCAEEWQADIDRVPGGLFKLGWAMGTITTAAGRRIAWIVEGEAVHPMLPPLSFSRADRWSWASVIPTQPPTIGGDVTAALALGVADSEAGLREISELLAISSEGDGPCTVTWVADGEGAVTVCAESTNRTHQQRFVRASNGHLVAEFSYFFVREGHQVSGVVKRLLRNSMIVFDRVGVSHACTFAEDDTGGRTWAKLGAVPYSPELCRAALLTKLEALVANGEVSPAVGASVYEAITMASDQDLMFDAARMYTEDHEPVGEKLFAGASWEAFFDMSDPGQRTRIEFALAG